MTAASSDGTGTSSTPSGPSPGPGRRALRSLAEHWKTLLPAFGGFALLLHFWRIGYAPSLSFGDLGTVLGALLLFSLGGLIVFIVILVLPSMLIGYWIESNLLPPPPKPAASDPTARRTSLKSYHHRPRAAHPPRARRSVVFGWHPRAGSLSWFMLAAAWTLLAYVGVLFAGVHVWPEGVTGQLVVGMFTIALVGVLAVTMSMDIPQVRRRLRALRRMRWQFALISLLYFAFWPIAVLPFFAVDGELRVRHALMASLALLLVPFVHWMLYATYRIASVQGWWVKGAMIGLVLCYSGAPLAILDGGLNAFGLGMMRRVDLVLTGRGCEIVHAAWPERLCTPDHRGEAGAYRLENVEVLTRIGAHVYVAVPGGIDDDRLPRATIPADEVLTWHRTTAPAPATTPSRP